MFKKLHADLYCGLSFFTRLPVGWLHSDHFPFSFARAIWTWPWVGLLLGAITGGVFFLLNWIGFSAWVVALITLTVQLLLTGGLHEDGLADTMDGFGGGKDKEHRLKIMRDSAIGSYGTLSLIILLGVKSSALAILCTQSSMGYIALMLSNCLARTSMLVPLFCTNAARKNGVASQLEKPPLIPFWAALIAAAVISFAFLRLQEVIILWLAIFVIAYTIAKIAYHKIGGYTGDVLGATETINEAILLVLLSYL